MALPSPPIVSALGLAMSLSLACAGDTSLNAPGSTTEPDLDTTDTTSAETPPAPTARSCPAECSAFLVPDWVYEGPPGERAVVEMLRDEDGSFILATRRASGEMGLVGLASHGEWRWATVPDLPCAPCDPADIALLPGGDVVLSITSGFGTALAAAVVARFDPAARELVWFRSFALNPSSASSPRAGDVAVLGEDRIVQLRVNGLSEGESLRLLDLDGDGEFRRDRGIWAQMSTGPVWAPLLAATPDGGLVMAHTLREGESSVVDGVTRRMIPPDYTTLSQRELPLPLDDLAIDHRGRRIELSRSATDETITLLVTSRLASDPEQWNISLPLVSTSSTRGALAVGPDDDIYVAARTSPELGTDAFIVQLDLARLSPAGELRWQTRQPLDMMATADPLEVLVDDDDGLVVGTVIHGQLNVRRYEQACACD